MSKDLMATVGSQSDTVDFTVTRARASGPRFLETGIVGIIPPGCCYAMYNGQVPAEIFHEDQASGVLVYAGLPRSFQLALLEKGKLFEL